MSSSPSETRRTACFYVHAAAEPGVMPRVLELFAKRGLVPSAWHSATAGAGGRDLHIDIQMTDMEAAQATYIAECLRQVADVETVLIAEKDYARTA